VVRHAHHPELVEGPKHKKIPLPSGERARVRGNGRKFNKDRILSLLMPMRHEKVKKSAVESFGSK
jgi:hypothetical protein